MMGADCPDARGAQGRTACVQQQTTNLLLSLLLSVLVPSALLFCFLPSRGTAVTQGGAERSPRSEDCRGNAEGWGRERDRACDCAAYLAPRMARMDVV